MLKLFGTKKKKSSFKPNQVKIPVPMINGVQYADMSDSQIQDILSHATNKKPKTPSLSSQKSNKNSITHITPIRSISSPPILVMPKPKHRLPPTLVILKNTEHEKTQVDTMDNDDDDQDLLNVALVPVIKDEDHEQPSHRLVSTDTKQKYSEPSNDVTRKSDDSNTSFLSASESSFLSLPITSEAGHNLNTRMIKQENIVKSTQGQSTENTKEQRQTSSLSDTVNKQDISPFETLSTSSQKNINNMPMRKSANAQNDMIDEMQAQIRKMALKEDVLELRRTLDMMEQQRILDRKELMSRVMEQKMREKEIIEQISSTKQLLEDALAKNLFNAGMYHDESQQQRNRSTETNIQTLVDSQSNIELEPASHATTSIKPVASNSTPAAKSRKPGYTDTQTKEEKPDRQYQRGRKPNYSDSKGNYDDGYFADAYALPQFNYHEFPPDRYIRRGTKQAPLDYDYTYPDMYGPPKMGLQQDQPKKPKRRQRSKSLESQWKTNVATENEFIPSAASQPRSRKSSLRSAKSMQSEGSVPRPSEYQQMGDTQTQGEDYFTDANIDLDDEIINRNQRLLSIEEQRYPNESRSLKRNSLRHRPVDDNRYPIDGLRPLPPPMFYHHAGFMPLPPLPPFTPGVNPIEQQVEPPYYGYRPDYFGHPSLSRSSSRVRGPTKKSPWNPSGLPSPYRMRRRGDGQDAYNAYQMGDMDNEPPGDFDSFQEDFVPPNGFIPHPSMNRLPQRSQPIYTDPTSSLLYMQP